MYDSPRLVVTQYGPPVAVPGSACVHCVHVLACIHTKSGRARQRHFHTEHAPRCTAGKPFAARPAKWLSSSRLAIVLMCFLIDYVIYRAWVMSVCKEEDQLVCLYRLLYAIMLVVWLEHEVELGRWEFSGKQSAGALSPTCAVLYSAERETTSPAFPHASSRTFCSR